MDVVLLALCSARELSKTSRTDAGTHCFGGHIMSLLSVCCDAASVVGSTLEDTAITTGACDWLVVRHKSGEFKATPLRILLGPYAAIQRECVPTLEVGGRAITHIAFALDSRGYVTPAQLSSEQVKKMGLSFGLNRARFVVERTQRPFEIYLYSNADLLVVSDVDGTLTKNDIGGHLHNFCHQDYLHEGYAELMREISRKGYHLVWLTMRSIALYDYSKDYIRSTTGVDGALLTEPEEFLKALGKEVLRATARVKANMLAGVRQLFTNDPFYSGLGNRDNDAVAYLASGIPLERIFIVDTRSRVQQLSDVGPSSLSYLHMCQHSNELFPQYSSPKIGMTP